MKKQRIEKIILIMRLIEMGKTGEIPLRIHFFYADGVMREYVNPNPARFWSLYTTARYTESVGWPIGSELKWEQDVTSTTLGLFEFRIRLDVARFPEHYRAGAHAYRVDRRTGEAVELYSDDRVRALQAVGSP